MKSKLENFLILFTRLIGETKNSPANLKWLPSERISLYGLCYDLDSCFKEISRLFIKKKTKHTIAPPIFSRKWDDYKKNWASAVAEAAKHEEERISREYYEEYQRAIEEALLAEGKTAEEYYREKGKTPEESYQDAIKSISEEDFLKNIEDALSASGKTPEEFYKEIGKTPEEYYQNAMKRFAGAHFDLDREERIDPLEDNPAAIMKELYGYINHFVGQDYEEIFNNKHLDAWDFFTDTIGIDYSIIYGRWQSAPELFIPVHMLSRNITPLEELYNEAVRAYVFGLTEASVAMCRALLEHVLKKYYHISGDDLNRVISEAERRHRNLRGLYLHSKRELANKVLHDYENRGQDIEKAAFDFLQTIRHLVTSLPSP